MFVHELSPLWPYSHYRQGNKLYDLHLLILSALY